MGYEELMRDARDECLTPSTRVRAAFDAIYACCPQVVETNRTSSNSAEELAQSIVERALSTLNLRGDDGELVVKLAAWILHAAPVGPLAMSPDEAVALVERVHKASTSDDA